MWDFFLYNCIPSGICINENLAKMILLINLKYLIKKVQCLDIYMPNSQAQRAFECTLQSVTTYHLWSLNSNYLRYHTPDPHSGSWHSPSQQGADLLSGWRSFPCKVEKSAWTVHLIGTQPDECLIHGSNQTIITYFNNNLINIHLVVKPDECLWGHIMVYWN